MRGTFEEEGLKFALNPLLEGILAPESLLLHSFKTEVQVAAGIIDHLFDVPAELFLLVLLVFHFLLDPGYRSEDGLELIGLQLARVEGLVFLLVKFRDQLGVALRFLHLGCTLEGVKFLEKGRDVFLIAEGALVSLCGEGG